MTGTTADFMRENRIPESVPTDVVERARADFLERLKAYPGLVTISQEPHYVKGLLVEEGYL
jgi:hypothetical protein